MCQFLHICRNGDVFVWLITQHSLSTQCHFRGLTICFEEANARAVSLKGTMRFSIGLLASCGALATAFVQNTSPLSTQKASVDRTKFVSGPFVADERTPSHVSSALSMAFDLKDGQVSNMFDGPLPLLKERDACGVGFIANTQSGGKIHAHGLLPSIPKACVITYPVRLRTNLIPCANLATYVFCPFFF